MKTVLFEFKEQHLILKEYELLCKDRILAEFSVGSGQVQTCTLNTSNFNILPSYLKIGNPSVGLQTMLSKRHIDFNRTNARVLLKTLNLRNSKSIINVLANHSLNLTDCYWTREKGSHKKFEEVTLYNKKESDFIVDISLSGVSALTPPSKFDINPELTNIGSFEKAWKNVKGEWRLYKRGTSYNYYAELFYYYLATYMKVECAEYRYDKELGMLYSVNITDKNNMLEHADAIPELALKLVEPLESVYLSMEMLDALTYNYDRHEFNWGLIRSSETGEVQWLAKLFDHNLCMGVDGEGKNKGPLGVGMLKVIEQSNLDLNPKALLSKSNLTMEVIKEIDTIVKKEIERPELNTTRQMSHWEEVIDYLNN